MNDCGESSPGTEKTAGSSLTVPLRNSARHSPIPPVGTPYLVEAAQARQRRNANQK